MVDTEARSVSYSEGSNIRGKLGLIAKILAAFTALGAIALRIMGYVSHETYLSVLGIDSGIFPKAADDSMLTGFFALADRTALLLHILNEKISVFLFVGGGVIVASAAAQGLGFLARNRPNKTRSSKLPEWAVEIGAILNGGLFILVGIPTGVMIVVLFLVTPILLGDGFGRSLAERDLAKSTTVCNGSVRSEKCVEIWKAGKLISKGFIFESSATHVALFDVNIKIVRTLERDGTELRSWIK